MIGYFIQQYWPDERADFFNNENNFYKNFQKQKIIHSNYWIDLDLLLIQYHLSTKNDIMPFTYPFEAKTVWNYSTKDKSISVIIPVVLKDFFELSEFERKKKFTDDSIYAVNLVREKLEKKKLDINFDKLLVDLQKCNEEFLNLN